MPTNSLVMVNPLLQILLPHLLIPRLLVKVIQVGPLLSEKVLVPLEMHIPFIIFLAIIYYRLPLVHFYPQCPLLLFLKMWMKHLIILDGDKPWLQRCRLLKVITLESPCPSHRARRLLVADECIQLKLAQMVRFIGSKPDWLQKGTLRFMALIVVTVSISWPRWLLFASSLPWQQFVTGHFINWISKMSSFMVILRRKFTWSNLLCFLLRGSLVWYVNCIVLYMA